MTVTAIRPASFSMSTSRDAYRALESPATSHPPESPPASSRPPDTQGHHHPKYPHLSVVHVVKERARVRLLPDRRKEARLYNIYEGGQRECSLPLDIRQQSARDNRPQVRSPRESVDSRDEVIRLVSIAAGRIIF
jgi:hypothetical protein